MIHCCHGQGASLTMTTVTIRFFMRFYMRFICILMLLAGTSIPAFASYEQALKLFENKQYEQSLKMVADELATGDDAKVGSPNYKLRYLAAHNHWKMGNHKSAIDHFKRCMDIKKDTVDPYVDCALLLIEQKRYADADQIARNGMKIAKSALLHYVSGMASFYRGNYWKAKELFETANAIDPELYISYNALGTTLMCLKKYSEANTAFSVALAIRPKNPQILNNMGMSMEKFGKYSEAYEYFKSANGLDDGNKIIMENMARVKTRIKK